MKKYLAKTIDDFVTSIEAKAFVTYARGNKLGFDNKDFDKLLARVKHFFLSNNHLYNS